jgi:hypothetical protein
MTVLLSTRSPARFVARMLPGATAADHAGLSIQKDKVPAGPKWLHELKFDGYRAQFTSTSKRPEYSFAAVTTDRKGRAHCRRGRSSGCQSSHRRREVVPPDRRTIARYSLSAVWSTETFQTGCRPVRACATPFGLAAVSRYMLPNWFVSVFMRPAGCEGPQQ